MITVKPIEDNIRKKELLASSGALLSSGNVLDMKDAAQELGYIVVDINHSILRLQSIHLANGSLEELDAESKLCVDFLMRAAASYGANHGAFRIENHIAPLHSFFVTKGFVMENGACAMPISRIVHVHNPNC